MSEELKRCGCGGEARILHRDEHGVCVRCRDCFIRTDYKTTEAKAIEAWNKAMGGVVIYPSTTPDGVYTSGCTITNTTNPNEDFHPVRDFMVNPERTAKVIYGNGKGYCNQCSDPVTEYGVPNYCPSCGVRLEWK